MPDNLIATQTPDTNVELNVKNDAISPVGRRFSLEGCSILNRRLVEPQSSLGLIQLSQKWSPVMTSDNEKPPWIDIAEQASRETDPRKLTALVEQLCDAIDSNVPQVDPANRADPNFDVA
jgi:hypothetical protein